METTSTDKEYLKTVKVALKQLVRPWEVLCGLTDIGNAYVPDIYAKSEEDYEKHIGDYMDAPTPVIDKKSGEIKEMDWDDEDLNEALKNGDYIVVQKKPEYAR